MLIRALRAENFLKFRRIEIDGFSGRGVIGITGPNEGGKSTIGELIQFVLFGKTHSMLRGAILDLIHWDHDHCIVEMDFESGTEHFRIWREMDRFGTSFARLILIDGPGSDGGTEIASGALQVQRELLRRFHFSFEDFLRSFYLSERDFPDTPERFRDFLDRTTGCETLDSARFDAAEEIGRIEVEFTRIQGEVKRNQKQIDRYTPNIARIPELEETLSSQDEMIGESKVRLKISESETDTLANVVKKRERIRTRLGKLDRCQAQKALEEARTMLREYGQDNPDLDRRSDGTTIDTARGGLEAVCEVATARIALDGAVESAEKAVRQRLDGDGEGSFLREVNDHDRRRQRSLASRRSFLIAAACAFLIGAAGVLVGLNDALSWGPEILVPYFPQYDAESFGILVVACGAIFWVLSAWLAARASEARNDAIDADSNLSRLRREKEIAEESADFLQLYRRDPKPLFGIEDSLDDCRIREVKDSLEEYHSKLAAARGSLPKAASPGKALAELEGRIQKRLREQVKGLRKEMDGMREMLRKQGSKRDRSHSEIREYQNQEGRRAALDEQNNALRRESLGVREEMDVHHILIELLEETIDSIRLRAGPSLGKGLRRLLPYLTDGRYQDLQVTTDFEVRLFTSVKSDFLATHELSGGTLEGLSVGFRLAFAQAFVSAVTGHSQFLFFDEPFKAMDENRIGSTLGALSHLSPARAPVVVTQPLVGAVKAAMKAS